MELKTSDKKTILLLEDEEQIREVVAEYLMLAGYEVVEASNAEESFDIIDDTSIDLAILDIMLPGVSGMEVLQYIKNNRASVPVIMLSALNDEQSQLQAFNYYADDYVSKPFSPILLLKRIETILRRVSSDESVKSEGLVLENEEY
ncbi:response regulator transcription factor [Fastidiosipila sanguinis]|uniref:response regulator transcription factor n=1 Tax=Fastidiosipila sanguinis TaxID=236753 RepID=UPI001FA86567|nr:response regulator [Fastidiosipila sanguinis]